MTDFVLDVVVTPLIVGPTVFFALDLTIGRWLRRRWGRPE